MALYAKMVNPSNRLISQIDTGEGKSRIMMILAACQAAQGKTVDFLTSDMQLAERDYLSYKQFFTSLGIPVYVEKPVAVSINDLNKFLELSMKFPRLIYAAEYCVEGKAFSLLTATGCINENDQHNNYLQHSDGDWRASFIQNLGPIKNIQGKLLEGEGPGGTAEHKAWLLDGKQGGMIRDLASHLFGPLYDIGFANADVLNPKVILGKYEKHLPLGKFRPLQSRDEGETYARIEGNFITPAGAAHFTFEIGKYWPKHDRKLKIECKNGEISLNYEKPFQLTIQSDNGTQYSNIITAEQYALLAFLDFKQFLTGKTHGKIGRAAAIVKFNETMRNCGLKETG